MSQLRQRLQAAHLTPYFQAFWGLGDGHLCGWVWYLSISRFTCQLLANSPSQKAEVMLRQLSGFLLAQINTQCVSGMERSKCGWRTKSMWVWWRQRTKGHQYAGAVLCGVSEDFVCLFQQEKVLQRLLGLHSCLLSDWTQDLVCGLHHLLGWSQGLNKNEKESSILCVVRNSYNKETLIWNWN